MLPRTDTAYKRAGTDDFATTLTRLYRRLSVIRGYRLSVLDRINDDWNKRDAMEHSLFWKADTSAHTCQSLQQALTQVNSPGRVCSVNLSVFDGNMIDFLAQSFHYALGDKNGAMSSTGAANRYGQIRAILSFKYWRPG